MDLIYLDNNASTPLLPAVWEAMRPFFFERAGNPASSHAAGRQARQGLEDARERVAALLDAFPDEVIFTSGATEANNLAIFGLAGSPPGHILASPIEHPCVKEPLGRLGETGFQLDWLPVLPSGVVSREAFQSRLTPQTRLVAIMLANHETGAVQPIRELAGIAGPAAFHCDAAAAAGKMPISFRELGVTSLALCAHKSHGPKGIGVLLVKRGTRLRPQLWGGHQQQGRRPGTEPVPLAVGLATALELACTEMNERRDRVTHLRGILLQQLRTEAAPVVINGPESEGIPHTLNVSFPGCRADVLLMNLDLAGVACATGSACSSGSLLPSPVLQAMGKKGDILHSAMRFSFSHLLTEAEIFEAARRIAIAVTKLRAQPV
jgi:cysteine desulfurase